MCGNGLGYYSDHPERSQAKEDPAEALACIIRGYGPMNGGYPEFLRQLVRDHWPSLCVLAHRIHDQETSVEVAINRAAARLGRDPGIISSFMECVEAAGLEIKKKETK